MFLPKLVILTGASAAGKTTIARKIAAEAFSRVPASILILLESLLKSG